MKRRKFITLLGGAAVGWPLAARAQQAERVRRIGVLMHLAADDPDGQSRVAAFLQGLQEAGWAVGRNVNVDVRWAAGEADRYRRYATEIVALTPDVILTSATPSIRAICRSARGTREWPRSLLRWRPRCPRSCGRSSRSKSALEPWKRSPPSWLRGSRSTTPTVSALVWRSGRSDRGRPGKPRQATDPASEYSSRPVSLTAKVRSLLEGTADMPRVCQSDSASNSLSKTVCSMVRRRSAVQMPHGTKISLAVDAEAPGVGPPEMT